MWKYLSEISIYKNAPDRDALLASCLSDDPEFVKNLIEKALNVMLAGKITDLLRCEEWTVVDPPSFKGRTHHSTV